MSDLICKLLLKPLHLGVWQFNPLPIHRLTHRRRPKGRQGGHRTLLTIVVGLLFAGLCAGVFWLSERQAQKMGAGFPQLQEQTLSLTDQYGVRRSSRRFSWCPTRNILWLYLLP
jgi:uncharacterized protein YneF (UPF0154 family)